MNAELLDDLNRKLKASHRNGQMSKLAMKQVKNVVRDAMRTNGKTVDVDDVFNTIASRTGIAEKAKQPIRQILDELFAANEQQDMTANETHDNQMVVEESTEDRALSEQVDAINDEIAAVLEQVVQPVAMTIEEKFHEMLRHYRAEQEVLAHLGSFLDRYKPLEDERSWRDELQFA
jgi:hypothetical protein